MKCRIVRISFDNMQVPKIAPMMAYSPPPLTASNINDRPTRHRDTASTCLDTGQTAVRGPGKPDTQRNARAAASDEECATNRNPYDQSRPDRPAMGSNKGRYRANHQHTEEKTDDRPLRSVQRD